MEEAAKDMVKRSTYKIMPRVGRIVRRIYGAALSRRIWLVAGCCCCRYLPRVSMMNFGGKSTTTEKTTSCSRIENTKFTTPHPTASKSKPELHLFIATMAMVFRDHAIGIFHKPNPDGISKSPSRS